MTLTLFTGIAELDAQIFSNVNDIGSLRNLYVTSEGLRNYMKNILIINNIKNTLNASYKTNLLTVLSFDEIMDAILPIHCIRMIGKHAFYAFLLRQNRFDLIENFLNKRIYPAVNSVFNYSFQKNKKEKSYYSLIKYLAKNELLAELKNLIKHIDFTEKLAKQLCREFFENFNGEHRAVKKREVTLNPNILEYLIELFPSLLNEIELIYYLAASSNTNMHKILRNNVEWCQLYPIIKVKFMCYDEVQTAICLLNAYPELYSDDEIIEHVIMMFYVYFLPMYEACQPIYEVCEHMYTKVLFAVCEIVLQQSRFTTDILNYWHVHHPDKNFWHDKLAQEMTIKLPLYNKTSTIINFMQENPNCPPRNIFKIGSHFIYKHKFKSSHQDQKQSSHRKHHQKHHLCQNQPTKSKRFHYNQPTSHKHQCRNYRKEI
jgi:hypothetical protein